MLSVFCNSHPVVTLEVPDPRAAWLPQPRHGPAAERAPCVRQPPSCSWVFSERKCSCESWRGVWVFYLTSPLIWTIGVAPVSAPPSSQPQWRNRTLHCGSSLWCLKSVIRGSGKSMDLARSKFFQDYVKMGRPSFCSTQPVRKRSVKFQTSRDFFSGRIVRGVKHFIPRTCFLSKCMYCYCYSCYNNAQPVKSKSFLFSVSIQKDRNCCHVTLSTLLSNFRS